MTTSLSYAVCGVQRCGSSMLCKGLARLALVGDPQEYFWNWIQSVADEYGEASYVHWAETPWAREARIDAFEHFDRELRRHKTGANGVFGVQLMASYLDDVLARLPDAGDPGAGSDYARVTRWLQDPRYIRLARRDQVLQAVSTVIAAQTGVYNSTWPHPPRSEPVFDLAHIEASYLTILAGERRWDSFFSDATRAPLALVYEEFALDYTGTLERVLDFLEVDRPPGFEIGEAPLAQQATPRNLEWAERFRQAKGLAPPAPEPPGA